MMSPAAKAYAIEMYEAKLEREREEFRAEARARAGVGAEPPRAQVNAESSSSDDEKASMQEAAAPGVQGRPGSPKGGGLRIRLRPLNFLPKIIEPTSNPAFQDACRDNGFHFAQSPAGDSNLDFALCFAAFP